MPSSTRNDETTARARRLAEALRGMGHRLSHTQALSALAASDGARSRHVTPSSPPAEPVRPSEAGTHDAAAMLRTLAAEGLDVRLTVDGPFAMCSITKGYPNSAFREDWLPGTGPTHDVPMAEVSTRGSLDDALRDAFGKRRTGARFILKTYDPLYDPDVRVEAFDDLDELNARRVGNMKATRDRSFASPFRWQVATADDGMTIAKGHAEGVTFCADDDDRFEALV